MTEIDGEPYFVIRDVSAMPPFLMSIVSDTNLWIFAGSNGSYTAGRTDPDHALFPYLTADKILSSPESAGVLSIFHVERAAGSACWEPWRGEPARGARRHLHKHAMGTSVVFEEEHLGLRFRWSLEVSARYGLVRRCALANLSDEPVSVRYLDGFHHLLPAGVTESLYSRYSYLACAYMHHEREGGLGLFTLNSHVTDRAEPSESLRAACAWSLGHRDPTFLLSGRQISAFRAGDTVAAEDDVRAEFGAWLAMDAAEIAPGAEHRWTCAADTALDHASVLALVRALEDPETLGASLAASLADGQESLRRRVASADGLEKTSQPELDAHHFANTVFNCMRGGIPDDGYAFPAYDFAEFLRARSRPVAARHAAWLESLPAKLDRDALQRLALAAGDPQLIRLAREYLPLLFSRRHGDPSRPWNRFSILLKDAAGRPAYGYQGNWRDIFQNWESLSMSYPRFLEGMVATFLNASTADGYNPYRITRTGIEWEVLDPSDPWSHIGYWGDHQIVYLSRLLENLENHEPGRLSAGLAERLYASANVPYEIAGFEDLLRDPRQSISFGKSLHGDLLRHAGETGNDGKLLAGPDGEPVLFSLAEKLMVPVMAKLGNLVPGGGIWLNTQRPEWNDSNNSLAGWGLSVVTVFQLHRHLVFLKKIFSNAAGTVPFSLPSLAFLRDLDAALKSCPTESAMVDAHRMEVVRSLGLAGEKHRKSVYSRRCPDMETVPASEICGFLDAALPVLEATLKTNFREDGLVHSYNILSLRNGGAAVTRLDLMLEGQAAAIGSGVLSPAEAVRLLHALKASPIYREDQHSYMLQPDREIKPFLSRNRLPADAADRSALIRRLLAAADRSLVVPDAEGGLHFHPDFTNAADLEAGLVALAARPEFEPDVRRDRELVHHLWEEVFHHSAFTGRSGSIFGFEGLGSIYWHMVAKLLLAVQECHRACADSDPSAFALAACYKDIRDGLGFRKTPEVYGAFPTDPYSHTPRNRGAQQPGMTGQVKEELLTRLGELGADVRDGRLHFEPRLLEAAEFLAEGGTFSDVAVGGREQEIALPASSLAFTLCQVPVCLELRDVEEIRVDWADGKTETISGNTLPPEISREIFSRSGLVAGLKVSVPPARLTS
ncbi:MAG: hypothetical protein WCG76_03835 [Verrucomicrobiota bacterium]